VLEQLRRSQYGALVESGLSATAIATPDGRIVYRNRRFRALFDEASHVDALAPSARHAQRQALANAWFDSMREDATGTGRVDLERAEPSGAPTWITLQWNGFQSESGERLLALQASEAGPLKQMELAFTRL